MKNYNSLADALDDLRKRGYDADFEAPSFSLYCGDLDMRLDEEDFHVDESYRFEGGSGPDDCIFIYAISYNTGVKGTIVTAVGASASPGNSGSPSNRRRGSGAV